MERLADQLVAVNENAFSHGSMDGALYGGLPNTEDWTISAGGAAAAGGDGPLSARGAASPGAGGMELGGEEGSEAGGSVHAMEIDVAPAGRLPFQEASLQVHLSCLAAVLARAPSHLRPLLLPCLQPRTP